MPAPPLRIMGYAVSAFAVVTGALVLSGHALAGAPGALRYTFGVVLVFYGIYRFLVVRMGQAPGRDAGGARMSRWNRKDRWEREDRWTRDADPDE